MNIAFSVLYLLRNSSQRKYFFRWLGSLEQNYFLQKRQPWLTFATIDLLNLLQLGNKRVFEYGSGGSTLYWLSHGARVTSIEHDQSWYGTLRDKCLSDSSLDYRLILPEPAGQSELDPANPDNYASADELFLKHSFRGYCRQIDEFPDDYFDIVLIDGRARSSCIMHAHTKVRIGGLLILDNSDRDYYLRMTMGFLQNYERKILMGATPGNYWFTETSVFTRKV